MLRNLFKKAVVTEVGDNAALTRAIEIDGPFDLILLDLLFPGFDATTDFISLRRKLPLTPIVAVSMIHDNPLIDRVMSEGANGFISKAARAEDIIKALQEIFDGETIVLRASGNIPTIPESADLSALTNRQIDVLKYIARGMSNKEIARELDISPYTVRIHVSAMLRTLGLPSRAAAASFAASRGLS